MSHEQKVLIRYWFVVALGVGLTLKLTEIMPTRWLIVPALVVAAFVDKLMRPATPHDVPSPLEIIQGSKYWQVLLGFFALGAVVIAVLSATFNSVGFLLAQNTWIVTPMIFLVIGGPIIQNQIALFRALGEKNP
jgi:hypothetical protein